jgi:non-specific protein-tyrosine kinase
MKLRQALEKARQMRREVSDSPEPTVRRLERRIPGNDWKPPVYSESNKVDLAPGILVANRCVCVDMDRPEIEYYKVLRTKIQHITRPKDWKVIMITSPREAEGKTLTAINLALTFAKAYNQTVMLVDCDLRRQDIHQRLGIDSEMGLVDYLVDEKPLRDFIIWPGIEQMTVISGGRPVQNSAELLGSERMRGLVNELKARYEDRYILLDAAPVLVNADALALAAFVDCILLVVNDGASGLKDIKKTLASLPQEKIIGYVLNRQKNPQTKGSRYYY